jgi:hypothetical protein
MPAKVPANLIGGEQSGVKKGHRKLTQLPLPGKIRAGGFEGTIARQSTGPMRNGR